MRHVSDKGLLFIAREEGVVLNSYKDSKGVWTIGVGHTKHAGKPYPKAGMELSFEEAIDLFRKDIRKYEKGVHRALKEGVPQHVFDAAVSFHYNTGGIHRASWVRALNAGEPMREVKKRFMFWRKPTAIINRRKREASLLVNGDYGDLSRIPVYRATHYGKVLWGSVTHVNGEEVLAKLRSERVKEPEKIEHVSETSTENNEKSTRVVQQAQGETLWDTLMAWIGKMFSRTRA